MKKRTITLGVDIGGSKILMIAWDGRRVLKKWQSQEVSLAKLKEGVDYFQPDRIGLAVPGIIHPLKGTILKCPNLPFFEGLDLNKLFKQPCRFDNDVNCFLLAERRVGLAKGRSNVLALTLGTGIGGALLVNGRPYKGQDGSAGEFGHMVLDQGETWEKLYQASQYRPKEQRRVNSLALANLINAFNPELIILGGRGASQPDFSLLAEKVISPLAKKTKIVRSKLGPAAVALGSVFLYQQA